MTELRSSPPDARQVLDIIDPQGDIARAGLLRKEKSKNDRYVVLWSQPLQGTKPARLELYNDEKTFKKQKAPRRTIPIVDILAVNDSSASEHSFSILLKTRDQIIFVAASSEDKEQWQCLLMEFVHKRPNAPRLGYDWYFHSVEVCPQELGQVTGIAVIKPVQCCFAFNMNDIAVLCPLRHKPLFVCPIPLLRSCGFNGNMVYVYCGRRSPCGEGKFFFQTPTEAEARHIKESLHGEMCRRAPSSSPPGQVIPQLTRSPHSYSDGCHISDQHGHRPRVGAASSTPVRAPYIRQMSDPHHGIRVNSLQRSQTFHTEHHRASIDSFGSCTDDFSAQSPNSFPNGSRSRVISGYEDMTGRPYHDYPYEDMSPRQSIDGASRGVDYQNVAPISRSYSSSSECNSLPPQLNGIHAHLSSLSLKTDVHSYQNIDVKNPKTRIIAVPVPSQEADVEYANLPLGKSAPSRPPKPQSSEPICMPPQHAPHNHSISDPAQSWHNQAHSVDRMSQPDEIFHFEEGSPPRVTPTLPVRGYSS